MLRGLGLEKIHSVVNYDTERIYEESIAKLVNPNILSKNPMINKILTNL